MTAETRTFGFIGLGVMGEPMCRHLLQKSGAAVLIHDLNEEPIARLVGLGAKRARSVDDLASQADIVFISLPSGEHLRSVCEGENGLLSHVPAGRTVVDLGTSQLKLSRELASQFAAKGVDYADAPVARTRQAAEAGTLAITVGATPEVFTRIEPLLRTFAAEVTHCGPVGCGQIVKILNNMTVVGTVVALCEAAAIADANGIEPAALFDAFSKGSADSFALRNHGIKHVARRDFPKNVFSTRYMLKDMLYALDMARDSNITANEAGMAAELLQKAADLGFGNEYWPVIYDVMTTEAGPA